jgi:hypothetical protein
MPRAFHTAPASLTRTCAPRERQQPGQPRSFVPQRRFSLFLTESKLGCSTALTYLRRGGRRRGAPSYSRFFRPAVTRHGPWIRGSAAALSTGSAQNSFVSPSSSRRPSKWQRPLLIRFCPRESRLSFVPRSQQPATRTVISRTNRGSGDSDQLRPTATPQQADRRVAIRQTGLSRLGMNPRPGSQLRLCQPATSSVLPPCRTAFGNTARTDDHRAPPRTRSSWPGFGYRRSSGQRRCSSGSDRVSADN